MLTSFFNLDHIWNLFIQQMTICLRCLEYRNVKFKTKKFDLVNLRFPNLKRIKNLGCCGICNVGKYCWRRYRNRSFTSTA